MRIATLAGIAALTLSTAAFAQMSPTSPSTISPQTSPTMPDPMSPNPQATPMSGTMSDQGMMSSDNSMMAKKPMKKMHKKSMKTRKPMKKSSAM